MIDTLKAIWNRTSRPKLPLIWRIILVPVDIYAGVFLIYFLLRAISREALWPVALINVFLHWVLPPALILLIIMLLARRWRRSTQWGVLSLVYLFLYGGLFLPSLPAQACNTPCQPLRVMEFNIGETLIEEDAFTTMLESSDADIIGLIEVAPEQEPLLIALQETYPYYAIGGRKALLSRFPVQKSEVVNVVWEHYPAFLVADLDVNGSELQVILFQNHVPRLGDYVGEFAYHTWRGGENLSLDYGQPQMPTLILADLNGTDQNADVRTLYRTGYRDAFRAVGWGYGLTFPAHRQGWRNLDIPPVIRIDYILMSDHFRAVEARVGADTADSDHRPVLADLYFYPDP